MQGELKESLHYPSLSLSLSLFISTVPFPSSKVPFGSHCLFSLFLLAKEPAVANGTVCGRQTAPLALPTGGVEGFKMAQSSKNC